jgi:ankyrin repeat protein
MQRRIFIWLRRTYHAIVDPDFEAAVDAVVTGDLDTLRSMLRADPELVRKRSSRKHHATLLHYVAANGVEDERQRTPANALEIAKTLLDAGAEVDAVADIYDAEATTMDMLVSSEHPAAAGLQAALAELLLDRGSDINRRAKHGQTPVVTALAFGYLGTAEVLAKRGASLPFEALAGLGREDDVRSALPHADGAARHAALALAAQHGQTPVVQLLLDAGEEPNRYNPIGYHGHSTPLHQAVAADQRDVVNLLAERGARLDIRDTLYDGTPLDWAVYLKKQAIADDLRSRL